MAYTKELKLGITFAFVLSSLWFLGMLAEPILAPCVVAFLFAYLINPLVDKLVRYRTPRVVAVLLIILIFLIALFGTAIATVPLIYSQLIALLSFVMERIPAIKEKISPLLQSVYNQLGPNQPDVARIFENFPHNLLNPANITTLRAFFNQIMTLTLKMIVSGINLTHTIVIVLITPLLAFHISCQWHNTIKAIDVLIPSAYRDGVRFFFYKINLVISAYIRGQVSVCAVMATYYVITLSVIGMNYSLSLGLLTGLLTFIPYIGSISCLLLAILMSLIQYDYWYMHAAVVAIFIVGQAIEGNIVVPLLIGKEIELHPIWIIIGMSICAAQFGFFGILLSIPITAIVSVTIKMLISKYMNSNFYQQ